MSQARSAYWYRRRSESGLGGIGDDLTRLERLAAEQRFDELLEAAHSAKANASDPVEQARASLFLAEAHVRRGADPRAAVAELMEARPVLEAAGEHVLAVECMDWHTAALHLLEDASALGRAHAALEECRRLTPAVPALEARILGRMASIQVSRREWHQAIDLYNQALALAGEQRDLSSVGKMYIGLGIVYEHLGDLGRSREFTRKAITIHELLNDRMSTARAENNLGSVLMRQGLLIPAREHIGRALDIFDELGVESLKAHALLSLAALDLVSGDAASARRDVGHALDIAERNQDAAAAGGAHQVLGRLSESIGDEATADREYGTAVDVFARAANRVRLVECLAEYAEVLEGRGDTRAALAAMKRAVNMERSS